MVVVFATSCKKSESELGKFAFKLTKNKVFKQIDDEAFAARLRKLCKEQANAFRNPKFMQAFYLCVVVARIGRHFPNYKRYVFVFRNFTFYILYT